MEDNSQLDCISETFFTIVVDSGSDDGNPIN